jgi:hypothetical protein
MSYRTSFIRHELSYKQLEVKTNRTSFIRHELSYKQLEVKTNRTSFISSVRLCFQLFVGGLMSY